MDVLKALQAELTNAYRLSSTSRLSERNIVDLLLAMKASGLDLIYSSDGKEVITPKQLDLEIRQQLAAVGGRVSLVDLVGALNVDLPPIQARASLLTSDPNRTTYTTQGELITRAYCEGLAEEINEILQDQGQVSLVTLAKQFSLSSDFILANVIIERLGSVVQGRIEEDSLVTDTVKEKYIAALRGSLVGCTFEMNCTSLATRLGIPLAMAQKIILDLLAQNRISGALQTRKDKSVVFVPEVYSQARLSYVTTQFKQNGFMDFATLEKFGLMDARLGSSKLFEGMGLMLRTCFVSKETLDIVDETIATHTQSNQVTDVTALVHPQVTADDISLLLSQCPSTSSAVVVLDEVYVVPKGLFQELVEKFEEELKKALQTSTRGKAGLSLLFFQPQPERLALPSSASSLRESAERKKLRSSKAEVDETAREQLLEQLTIWLQSRLPQEVTDNNALVKMLAAYLRPAIEESRAKASVASVISVQSQRAKPRTPAFAEKFNVLFYNIQLFGAGINELQPDVSSDDEKKDLDEYLRKTLCHDLIEHVIADVAEGYGIPAAPGEEIKKRVPPELAPHFANLVHSSEQSTPAFIAAVILEAPALELEIRKIDKKITRALLKQHRIAVQQQLAAETDPVNVFRLTLSVLYIVHRNSFLYTPTRLAPIMLRELEEQLPADQFGQLEAISDTVQQFLADKNADLRAELATAAVTLKEIARTTVSLSKSQ